MSIKRLLTFLLLVGAMCSAQTWTKKRAAFPPPTDITGNYTPVQATPGYDGQETMFYLTPEQKVCGMLPDKTFLGGEWSNGFYCYDPSADDKVSTSGSGTGWTLLWHGLNNALTGQAALWSSTQIQD